MFLLISALLLTFHFKLGCSQVIQDNKNCDDEGNCYGLEFTKCIADFDQLDQYILSNKTLQRKLAEAFFKTGQGASQFVLFTYKFQVSNISNNSDDGVLNLTDHTATFIWSTSVLYLLDPDPLYYLTLLAVRVPKADATIELPCFYSDVHDDLLDRLTYLVGQLDVIIAIL